MTKTKHTEAQVEERLRKGVLKLGGIAYKFTSPARRHVPDRLCLFPGSLVVFVECKAPGKQLRPAQKNEIKRLHELGHMALVIDDYEKVDSFLSQMEDLINERTTKRRNVQADSIDSQNQRNDRKARLT